MSAGLLAGIRSLPPAHAAVVDAALDPELQGRLAAARLPALPLYLEGGEAAVWSGPILVDLTGTGAADALLALPDGARATFWSWPGEMQALRRHLRSLNLVEVPAESIEAGATGLETVIFRHWDPNVLGPLLPLLSPPQRARLLGDAQGLALEATDHGGLIVAPRPVDLPPRPRGLLRFTPGQMDALSQARVIASRKRIGAYLRDVAPEQTASLDDRTLAAAVIRHEREGQALGIVTEHDLALWAFLQVLSGGVLFDDPSLHDDFNPRLSGRPPSETLALILDDVRVRLERGF